MSIEITILNKDVSLDVSLSLGDNNKIFLNEKEYVVTACYDANNKLHLRTDMCPLVVECITDEDEFKPNSNIVEIVLDLQQGKLESTSHVIYMYNKENSYIECYSTPILPKDYVLSVDKQLSVGFDGHINTSLFIQYLHRYSSDILATLDLFLGECTKYGVMKTTLPKVDPLSSTYLMKCIRATKKTSEFGELITRFYIETVYGVPDFSIIEEELTKETLLNETADILFIITDSELDESIIPSTKIVIQLQTGLFSMGRSLIRKCISLEAEIKEKGIKEYKMDSLKISSDEESTDSGCCGGNKNGGGCCGGGKCGVSFDEEVRIIDCETECTEENCCSKPKVVKPKESCCKGKAKEDCCKSSGKGCTCTDCKGSCA